MQDALKKILTNECSNVRTQITMPNDLRNEIDKIAHKHKMNRSVLTVKILRDFVEKYKKDNLGGF